VASNRRPRDPDVPADDGRLRQDRGVETAPHRGAPAANAVAVEPLGGPGHAGPNSIARPLVESLINEVVCKEHDIAAYVPDPDAGLTGFDRAVELALQRIRDRRVTTSWSLGRDRGLAE
jgi:hypothetical protein